MPVGRVPDVVGKAGRVDEIRVAAERLAEFAADLRALERVGEPGSRKVVLAGYYDLRLGS
jgi:hypothetical protein